MINVKDAINSGDWFDCNSTIRIRILSMNIIDSSDIEGFIRGNKKLLFIITEQVNISKRYISAMQFECIFDNGKKTSRVSGSDEIAFSEFKEANYLCGAELIPALGKKVGYCYILPDNYQNLYLVSIFIDDSITKVIDQKIKIVSTIFEEEELYNIPLIIDNCTIITLRDSNILDKQIYIQLIRYRDVNTNELNESYIKRCTDSPAVCKEITFDVCSKSNEPVYFDYVVDSLLINRICIINKYHQIFTLKSERAMNKDKKYRENFWKLVIFTNIHTIVKLYAIVPMATDEYRMKIFDKSIHSQTTN